jgi:hypothetical protein
LLPHESVARKNGVTAIPAMVRSASPVFQSVRSSGPELVPGLVGGNDRDFGASVAIGIGVQVSPASTEPAGQFGKQWPTTRYSPARHAVHVVASSQDSHSERHGEQVAVSGSGHVPVGHEATHAPWCRYAPPPHFVHASWPVQARQSAEQGTHAPADAVIPAGQASRQMPACSSFPKPQRLHGPSPAQTRQDEGQALHAPGVSTVP